MLKLLGPASLSAFLLAGCLSLLGGRDTWAAPADSAGAPSPEVITALKGLKTADADGRQKTYALLADKGDARFIGALKAYRDGFLQLRDDHLCIYGPRADVPGKGSVLPLIDAISGAPIAGPDGAPLYFPKIDLTYAIKQPPRSERSAINDLLSQLALLDPNPGARLQSIRGIAERAARGFINAEDTERLMASLKPARDTLAPKAASDPAAAAAVAAIDAAIAERPAKLVAPAPSAATTSALVKTLTAVQAPSTGGAAPDLSNPIVGALAAARNYSDAIDSQQKALDDLAKYGPILHKQLSADPSGRFAPALQESIAATDLLLGDPVQQKAAIETLGKSGTSRAQNLLQKAVVAAKRAADVPTEQAAQVALIRVSHYQLLIRFILNTFYGLSSGSILVLLALGLSIIFGLMGVINMAHGEFMMIGAFATYVVSLFFINHLPPWCFNFYPIIAIPVAFAVAGVVGFCCEGLIVRHLYGRPLETLLATWGMSLILIQAVRNHFGDNLYVKPPSWMEGNIEVVADLNLSLNRVFIVVYCAICIGTVYFLVNRTKLGLLLRATTQNRDMAAALGVATRRIDALTFAFGAGLAGLAGVAVPMYDKINPGMGQDYVVDSFLVVVVGGVGKLAGVIWSGLGMGFLNKYVEAVLQWIPSMESSSSVIGKVLVLACIVAFLQWRPSGLFPPRGRMADA